MNQHRWKTTCHSKALGLVCVIEWGLGDIEFLSPSSFKAKGKDRKHTFHAIITSHYNTMVDIPVFDEEFLVMLIDNKEGDNLILLTHNDCVDVKGTSVDFHWLAPRIKKKFHVTATPSDILS